VTGHRSRNRIGDGHAPVSIDVAAIVPVLVRPWGSDPSQREFVLWHVWAWISEEEPADRGDERKPTDRGPDKRPQGAALSVGCFYSVLYLIRQCAPSTHNVREPFNRLLDLYFSHIAEAGHG
jgi:hypothetical protein